MIGKGISDMRVLMNHKINGGDQVQPHLILLAFHLKRKLKQVMRL